MAMSKQRIMERDRAIKKGLIKEARVMQKGNVVGVAGHSSTESDLVRSHRYRW